MQGEHDVLRSCADRAEMCHHKLSNSGYTHADTQKVCPLTHALWHLSTLPPPHQGVCSPHYPHSCSSSLTSSLPVSNSNQSAGRRGGGGGERRGGHTKERPMGVSTTPDCGFCTLSLLATGQEFVRDFSSYFDCFHQGNMTSHVCLID